MNIYLHELRAYRKSLIIWCVSLVALLSLYMSLFPTITKDTQVYLNILQDYPEAVRNALGMNLATIASLLGFFSFTLTFMSLFGAIQAMNIGLSIVSKEVRERTADFLMTKPISRVKILTSKLLAAFTLILITNVVYIGVAALLANGLKSEPFDGVMFMKLALTFTFIQIMFLVMGITISIVLPKIKAVLTISMGVVFALFAVGAFIATGPDDVLRYVTPFKYFDPSYILQNGNYNTPFLITAILSVGIAITVSYAVYNKKNIHAV